MRIRATRLGFWLWLLSVVLPARAAEPLRFCVTADNRGHSDFISILQQMAKLQGGPGQFMISVGDVDPAQTTRGHLDQVFGKDFIWYPVVGNHELKGTGTDLAENDMLYLRKYYDARLKGKVNPGPKGTTETTYSFDAGDVHIAVINLYWDGEEAPESDKAQPYSDVVKPLRTWLEEDLQRSHKTWKLVVGHEPGWPQADRDWGESRYENCGLSLQPRKRQRFWSILEENGVAAYLCAHTHRYSRYLPEGSKVWQIDSAQARGDKSWQFDAFLIVTADAKTLRFDAYRNLKEQGKFTITDTLTLDASSPPPQK